MSENQRAKRLRSLLVSVVAVIAGWGAAAQAQSVKGSGTASTFPVWNSSSTIGNSIVSESGGNINVSGGVKASGPVAAPSFSGSFSGNGFGLSNVNASLLGGLGAAGFARLQSANTFVADQSIDGNLNLTGFLNNALTLQGNLTDSNGEQSANVIGGFAGNSSVPGNSVASGVVGATIAGGGGSLVGSPRPNAVTAVWGTVGGGAGNTAGKFGTVGGGIDNGSVDFATVSGGKQNIAASIFATVSGGVDNIASGEYAVVPGGNGNTAAGFASFAAGQGAKANSDGSFVWSDYSGAPMTDFGKNSFVARASGGFAFYTAPGPGVSTGAYLPSGSGSWASLSDRNAKANLMAVDGHAILDLLASLPIETWNYKTQSDSVRHIGPMAQDFRAAFGLGEDETHISTVDSEGIALAAIQALYQEKQQEVTQLKDRLTVLEERLAELESSK